jgi:uncharacterized protein involved in response to NO
MVLVSIRGSEPVQPTGLPTLLAAGFRPFFLLAGGYAVIAIAAWVTGHVFGSPLPSSWPAAWWHGHEMVFGFTAAVVAGFLLTAVPKWTGRPALSGLPLGALTLAWCLARVAAWFATGLPAELVAGADALFLFALAGWAARQIYGTRNRRNFVIPVLIVGLGLCDVAFHLQLTGRLTSSRPLGLHGAIYVIVVLMTLISGRIVPSFTASALRRREETRMPKQVGWLSTAAVVASAAALLANLAALGDSLSGGLALLATALLLARAAGWRFTASLSDPLLWILHLGHGWLIVGFGLLSLGHLGVEAAAAGVVHAFTAGAIGTLVIGVTTRAALGHSGRPLKALPGLVVVYALVSVGAFTRVFAAVLVPPQFGSWIAFAGAAWAGAFAVFVILYWPVLTRPRVDGRPG